MGSRAVSARVVGRVQGVGFRWSTLQHAELLGVHGWVRNNSDGSVQAWIEGAPDAVAAMLDWLHQGPRFAQVDRVEAAECVPAGHQSFMVAG